VTRGPGATNAAHGIHIAQHDSVPLILFVGQVDRSMRERGAFQEMDYRAFYGPVAKWATEIEDPARSRRSSPALSTWRPPAGPGPLSSPCPKTC
jgi:thiamine pyrophosphate-dependent acetolactate synthase large subunit-like protein